MTESGDEEGAGDCVVVVVCITDSGTLLVVTEVDPAWDTELIVTEPVGTGFIIDMVVDAVILTTEVGVFGNTVALAVTILGTVTTDF